MVVVAIAIKRTDIGEDEAVPRNVRLCAADADLEQLKGCLAEALDIADWRKKVFKLRAADGALLPLRKLLQQQCQQHDQYQLEVTDVHQTIPVNETERALLSETLENINLYKERLKKRVDRLEAEAPQLRVRKDEAMHKQISHLSTQLHYLSDKLDEMAASGSSGSSSSAAALNQYQ
ncbi:uncharacterized protein LOC135944092 isoform X2 [Cloeon dipterum]|uniref:uncharacterized protein LOC135944092 isoform X2 n=1 Tax=Cloeon dipterum TaxID=197152 RepID=UPI00321F8FA9